MITTKDNTFVTKPVIKYKIPRKLKTGEQYFLDGKTIIKPTKTYIQSNKDYRTKSQKERDNKFYKYKAEKQKESKNIDKTAKALGTFANKFLPSTIIRAGYDALTSDKSFSDSMMEDNNGGIANSGTADFIFDLTTPSIVGKAFKLFNTPKYIFNTQARVPNILSNQSLLTQDILEGAMQGYKDALKYYNSDQYLNHLINTGLSREQALELQKFKIGNLLDTKINFNHVDPNAYGHNVIEVATGSSRTELNPAMANTRSLARETTWHESGGHASSKNYKIEHQPVIDRDTYLRNVYSNSFYRKISEHNKELIPELKPQWKAYLDGDMDTFNKLATKEDYQIINKYKNPKEFINYINDEQEAAARAISANIGDFVGQSSQWNLPQLEVFFTKEGIKKLRDNVWSVGTSLGGGVAFEQIDYNPEK